MILRNLECVTLYIAQICMAPFLAHASTVPTSHASVYLQDFPKMSLKSSSAQHFRTDNVVKSTAWVCRSAEVATLLDSKSQALLEERCGDFLKF
ncbi:unnamed protein product [Onchocerca flexuosa]|uniref:Secreted protein n=1 Tax=Onchocerca flexuosa TaxID=387005 RepID=A0A183H6Z5_9BILA|nr:unnamed protein product [Onchocerca flexuosa]